MDDGIIVANVATGWSRDHEPRYHLIYYFDGKSPYAYLAQDKRFQPSDKEGIVVERRPCNLDIEDPPVIVVMLSVCDIDGEAFPVSAMRGLSIART